MSEKAITIYTPSDAEPHITAEDDAFIYNGILGGRSGFLGEMNCTVESGNLVLTGGGVSNRGYVMRIPEGESVSVTIPTGSQGMLRFDTVVSQFTKGGGTVPDTHTIQLVKGTPSTDPELPTLITSDLTAAGDINQIPLFYVVMYELEVYSIFRASKSLGINYDAPEIYVQSDEPSAPKAGDLWFW